jgi:hypothetical protein
MEVAVLDGPNHVVDQGAPSDEYRRKFFVLRSNLGLLRELAPGGRV